MLEVTSFGQSSIDVTPLYSDQALSTLLIGVGDVGGALAASSSAQAAAESAAAANSSALNAASSAQTATTQAGVATTQAGIAATQAGVAGTKANEASASASTASTKASEASASASSASTSASTATTQAGVATTQAGIATIKAGEASTSATTASTQAGIATTKASEANDYATTASTQAGIATTKANEASASASTATTQANTATTKASEAAASAAAALASQEAAATSVINAATSETNAATSAAASGVQAGNASASALTAQTAANNAVAVVTGGTASLTSSAGKIPIADATGKIDPAYVDLLAGTSTTLHRSPNAITAMFLYDTSKDSDGGAWTEKCQHTSWYNEALNGKWLGAQASELNARYEGATLGSELLANGTFDSSAGWLLSADATIAGGTLNIAATSQSRGQVSPGLTIGKAYRGTLTVSNVSGSRAFKVDNAGTGGGTTSYYPDTTATNGTVSFVFTPTLSGDLRIIAGGGTGTFSIDNISVKEVTAQTTATGDYFQLTTDGKFYKLNATSGTTEVFRGNKKSFPKVAGILTEANSLTIYDLTEPGRPMWMRFVGGVGYFASTTNITSIAALNGIIGYSINNTSWGRTGFIDFPKDTGRSYRGANQNNVTQGFSVGNIANRLTAAYDKSDLRVIADVSNAVAMTVLPDAPVDPVTGLKVPTIAVATNGGVSVIQNNGTVRNSSTTNSFSQVTLTPQLLSAGQAGTIWYYAQNPNTLGASFALPYDLNTAAPDFNGGNTSVLKAKDRSNLVRSSGAVVQMLRNNESSVGRGITTKLSSTFNAGHLLGDIRRCFLSDITTGSVTGPELVTNGTFDTDTTGWSADRSAVLSVDTNRLKVVNGPTGYGGASQLISGLVVGKTYWVSVDYTHSNGNGFLCLASSAGANGTRYFSSNVIYNSGKISGSFVASTTSAYLSVSQGSSSAEGTIAYFDNISVREVIPDRSYKAAGANIYGTLTASAVNTGNSLVAYSGFSS